MITTDFKEKMEVFCKDENFITQMQNASDNSAVISAFAAKNYTITDEEATTILACLNEQMSSDGELSAEELESVAGGCAGPTFLLIVGGVVILSLVLKNKMG